MAAIGQRRLTITDVAIGRQFLRFLLVGGVGFIVDGGLLAVILSTTGAPTLPSRFLSFSIAVTATWFLNRRFTFRDLASSQRVSEWRRYVAVNSIGGAMNLGIFAVLVTMMPAPVDNPYVAFTIASAAAMIFNFVGSRRFAFRAATRLEGRQEDAPPF